MQSNRLQVSVGDGVTYWIQSVTLIYRILVISLQLIKSDYL